MVGSGGGRGRDGRGVVVVVVGGEMVGEWWW